MNAVEKFDHTIALLNKAKKMGLSISSRDGQLEIKSARTQIVDPLIIDELRNAKPEILAFLNSEKGSITALNSGNEKIKAVTTTIGEQLPLSFAQERLWFIHEMQGSLQYHIPTLIRIDGALDVHALELAFREIVNRHAVLRSTIHSAEGIPYQLTGEADQWKLDYRPFDNHDLNAILEEVVMTSFDLTTDSLLRVTVVQETEISFLAILVMHHIASDGWSRALLVNELQSLYSAYKNDVPHVLPVLPVQYTDYARWQQQHLTGPVLEKQLKYWKEKLTGIEPVSFPTDLPRPSVQQTNGASVEFFIDASLTAGLQTISRQEGATLYMTLLSALYILLNRYSGQDDLSIGSPIANRVERNIEPLIGFFANTLVLRNQVPNISFRDFLQQVKANALEAYENQDAPFEKIVEQTLQERDLSRSPLFQVMFVMQNVPEIPALEMDGIRLTVLPFENTTTKFDLTFDIKEAGDKLNVRIEYCTDLFKNTTIQRLFGHYKELLRSAVKNPDEKTGLLNMLSDNELMQLKDLNNTSIVYPAGKRVIDLFEIQADISAESIAVTLYEDRLTYRQLNETANQLARVLQEKGIDHNSLVGVCMERSVQMVVSILAILKTGAAYVPVDPAYPSERIAYMLEDADCALLISSNACKKVLEGLSATVIVYIESLYDDATVKDAHNIEREKYTSGLTYIIYTSGSTGKPKGIAMPDKALYNLLLWQQEQVGNKNNKRVLQFASLNFDASFQEIFMPLCFGGQLFLIEEEKRKDMEWMLTAITANRITHLFIPYIVLKNMAETAREGNLYPGSLEEIFTAGEQVKLSEDIKLFIDNTGCLLQNYYGPSETHVVTAYQIRDTDFHERLLPPIGKPISNTTVYVVSAMGQLCPVGVPGELYIGGVQVAEGYINRPELSSEKFITTAFDGDVKERVYRTGDVCRWLEDGNLEFMGRMDDQVKVRGYRVELAEVEIAMLKAPGIKKVVVIAQDDTTGGKRLVAYIETAAGFKRSDTEVFLKATLPDFMIPSLLIEIDSIPITNNGKIDKRRLPAINTTSLTNDAFTEARNATEAVLAAIWARLLQLDRVSVEANFFRMGGHSLLATRIVSAIRKELHVGLSIRDVFTYPTIATLAVFIQSKVANVSLQSGITRSHISPAPLSFSQERIWFLDQLNGSNNYHIPVVLRLSGNLDKHALENALLTILQRQEALRSVIKTDADGKAYQHLLDYKNWVLADMDLTTATDPAEQADTIIKAFTSKSFDLSTDYNLRALLITQAQDAYILTLVIHHIACDGWSLFVLLDELTALYKHFSEKQQHLALPEMLIQYADFAAWQKDNFEAQRFNSQLDYWKQQLQDAQPLGLSYDYTMPAVQSTRGGLYSFSIDQAVSNELNKLGNNLDVTPFMLLLAVFKLLLHRYTDQDDICIGTSITNRSHKELEAIAGLFVNTIVIRNDLADDPLFTHFIKSVKETTLHAYENQDIPFEKIVEALGIERDLGRTPLFQVMFELQHAPRLPALSLGDVQICEYPLPHTTSKFELTVVCAPSPEGFEINIEYCADLFSTTTIERMAAHYTQLLQSVVSNPVQRLSKFEMMLPEEYALLKSFSQPQEIQPVSADTMTALFEQQVLRSPGNIAVVDNNQSFTYLELNEKANQLAHYLAGKNITTEMPVLVLMERSAQMIISILAIMKAGAVYVPVDPAHPAERLAFLISDLDAYFVITTDSLHQTVIAAAGAEMINLETQAANIAAQPTANLPVFIQPTQLAYIIYTSGSTGAPKGAMIEHAGMLNHLQAKIATLQIDANTILAQTASHTFDISVWQMFAALLKGGTTIVYADECIFDVQRFLQQLLQDKISILELVPSYLQSLLEEPLLPDLNTLQYLLVTGETVSPKLLVKWFEQYANIPVINAYGPTEASDDICHYLLTTSPGLSNSIPIGKPIQQLAVYVVNKSGALCPIGITGEVWVSGIGVGRGYWNDPVKTAKSFSSDPFSTAAQRLYKTGDMGRWLPDGNLEYFGRKDDQVKLYGHRIEIGEIENVLLQAPGITGSVVVLKEGKENRKRLVAYITASAGWNKIAVIDFLGLKLPGYMVPADLVLLPAIPLTANGKIDKKQLPDVAVSSLTADSYVAPETAAERILADIWSVLLQKEGISIHDNFFVLGGDSILAIQLVSRAKRAGLIFQLKDVFSHQTIASLAKCTSSNIAVLAEQGKLTGTVGLLPIQQYFFEQSFNHRSHYNQSLLLEVDKTVQPIWLQQAVEVVLQQHDALHVQFNEQAGTWNQVFGGINVSLETATIPGTHDLPVDKRIAMLCNQFQESLDINAGILSRFVFITMPDDQLRNRLFITIHHLVIDGVSWRILVEDLERALEATSQGQAILQEAKGSSVREWHHALQEYATSKKLAKEIPYWQKIFTDSRTLQHGTVTENTVLVKDVATRQITLDRVQTDRLVSTVHKAYKTEINDILLAALVMVMGEWNKTNNLLVGMEGHGRETIGKDIDVTHTAGWFTTLFPVLLKAQHTDSINYRELITSVKEQLRAIPGKGIGYGVLRYLHPDANIRNTVGAKDRFDIVYNYMGKIDHTESGNKWFSIASEWTGHTVAADNQLDYTLAINCSLQNDHLQVSWSYSTLDFDNDLINRLLEKYKYVLDALIQHCIDQPEQYYTPADFRLYNMVETEELNTFLEKEQEPGLARKNFITDLYPLSPMQQGMLFHSLYGKSLEVYVLQFSADIKHIDLTLFRKSWNHLLHNHSILRSAFYYDTLSVPVQAVNREVEIPFKVEDIQNMPVEQCDEYIRDFLRNDRQRRFDFDKAPLMRISMLQYDTAMFKMVWTFHHILIDGWSLPVLVKELFEIYHALRTGTMLLVKPADLYRDYIDYIHDIDKEEEAIYWKQYLSGIQKGSLFPFVPVTVERNKGVGEYRELLLGIDEATTILLQQYAQRHRLTVNTIVQGVWSYLLSKYTGDVDVVFGVTVSGRPEAMEQTEQRVGLYINTIPLRVNIPKEKSVTAWLQQIQEGHQQSREYQYISLASIQSWQGIKGDLFDNILVFQNYPLSDLLTSQQGIVVDNVFVKEQTNYILSIIAVLKNVLQLRFKYNARLLDLSFVEMMSRHFETIIRQVIQQDEISVADLDMSKADTAKPLQDQPNAVVTDTVISMFEKQVLLTPQAPAVNFRHEEWTYEALNHQANQLASYLIKKGVQPGNHVVVCLDRSIEMLVAILAVLKTGAAYVPVDANSPADRISYLIQEVKPAAVLAMGDAAAEIMVWIGAPLVMLDIEWSLIQTEPGSNLEIIIDPAQLAYTIYTSGSTGRPKGVMVEHASLSSYLQYCSKNYIDKDSSISGSFVHLPVTFDAAVTGIFLPLITGKRMVLSAGHSVEVFNDPNLQRYAPYDFIKLTPVHIPLLAPQLASYNPGLLTYRLVSGGESLQQQHLQSIPATAGNMMIINEYGPTETTVGCSTYSFRAKETVKIYNQGVSIGKPIDHVQLYILDADRKQVPTCVAGELYIGGTQVARGYLNEAALTAEKFIENPFSNNNAGRLYKTGDQCRWLPDGNIEFLGRMDNQVKIKGYRIEPAETQMVLLQAPGVLQGVVIAKDDRNGYKRLVAYVSLEKHASVQAIHQYMETQLPDYMLPALLLETDIFPMTAHGKIDTAALSAMDQAETVATVAASGPENQQQKNLLLFFEDLLHIKGLGVNDNLFNMGLDSLKTIEAQSLLNNLYPNKIQIYDLFSNPSVAQIALLIDETPEIQAAPALRIIDF